MSTRLGPDFFIVGAPKCGTTALDAYLSAHPAIFMARKEQHYFGEDLAEIWNHPEAGVRPTTEQYFREFEGTEWATRRGDASVWYLWSSVAAREIHDYEVDARIIIQLRNPVDMLASLHSQSRFNAVEDIEDFEEAIAAEADRHRGRRIPPNNGPRPWRLFYREVASFHDQVKRYLDVFGRDQVHVVFYEDLVGDTADTYRGVLRFLGVDTSFAPEFEVVNANKRIRSRTMQRTVWQIEDDKSWIRRGARRALPRRLRMELMRHALPRLRRVNTEVKPRGSVSPELRSQLMAELRPDVLKLAALLGRDLSHWLDDATAPNHASSAGARLTS